MDIFKICYRKILYYSKQETNNFVDQKCSKAKNSQDSYLWMPKAIKKSTDHCGEKFTT